MTTVDPDRHDRVTLNTGINEYQFLDIRHVSYLLLHSETYKETCVILVVLAPPARTIDM